MTEAARPANSYELNIPGLEEAVAAATPHKAHKHLLDALRKATGEPGWAMATTRDEGGYWSKRKVLDKNGAVLAEDHTAWLRIQLAADAGDMPTARKRLQMGGYQLSKCHISEIYFVRDRGGAPWNYAQVRCVLEHEVVDRPLFNDWDRNKSYAGQDFGDFVRDAEDAYEHPEPQRTPIRDDSYQLSQAIDCTAFLDLLDQDDESEREQARQKRFKLIKQDGSAEIVPYSRLDPNFDKFPHKARRFFTDWEQSSAGKSGARLSDHWITKANDYTDPSGKRWVSFIPMWTHTKKIAKIDADKGSDYDLYSKLQKLDDRVSVPFAWYFYMLHGNLVTGTAGERIIALAEQEVIDLPENDYQVLRRWRNRQYGF